MSNPSCKVCGGSGYQEIVNSTESEVCESCNSPPNVVPSRAIIQKTWDEHFLSTLGPNNTTKEDTNVA